MPLRLCRPDPFDPLGLAALRMSFKAFADSPLGSLFSNSASQGPQAKPSGPTPLSSAAALTLSGVKSDSPAKPSVTTLAPSFPSGICIMKCWISAIHWSKLAASYSLVLNHNRSWLPTLTLRFRSLMSFSCEANASGFVPLVNNPTSVIF